MLLTFSALSLCYIPLGISYSRWSALADDFLPKVSIGNMGQAKTYCDRENLSDNIIDLRCDTGYISEITHFGLNHHKDKNSPNFSCKTNWLDKT